MPFFTPQRRKFTFYVICILSFVLVGFIPGFFIGRRQKTYSSSRHTVSQKRCYGSLSSLRSEAGVYTSGLLSSRKGFKVTENWLDDLEVDHRLVSYEIFEMSRSGGGGGREKEDKEERQLQANLAIDHITHGLQSAMEIVDSLHCKEKEKEGKKGVATRWGGYCANRGTQHHAFDDSLAKKSFEVLFEGKTDLSIGDFGAGPGHYGDAWKKMFRSGQTYRSFDGAAGTEEVFGVELLNLIHPIPVTARVPLFDWIVSLEVGEHVPEQFERTYIDNVDLHATKGILLSWGIIKQSGPAHVNCHRNEWVQRQFESRGWTYNAEVSIQLRQSATRKWFQNTIMVFERM